VKDESLIVAPSTGAETLRTGAAAATGALGPTRSRTARIAIVSLRIADSFLRLR
jgi:hypothetical protein